MVSEVDSYATGNIMFPNFLCLMSKKFSENNAEDEIREAFRVFDSVSSSATLDVKDFFSTSNSFDLKFNIVCLILLKVWPSSA